MIPIAPIFSFLGGGKAKLIGGVVVVVIVAVILGGMLLRIEFLKAEAAQLRIDVKNFNATLVTEQALRANAETRANSAEADEEKLHTALDGKDQLIAKLRAGKARALRRQAELSKLVDDAKTVDPKQAEGVVDYETSDRFIDWYNARLRLRSQGNGTAAAAGADY